MPRPHFAEGGLINKPTYDNALLEYICKELDRVYLYYIHKAIEADGFTKVKKSFQKGAKKMTDELRQYYEEEGLEELRLEENGVQYTEFLTITSYFNKVLPKGCRILDPCAGTGAYAFYLADQGHQVVAGELLEINLNALREKEQQRKAASPPCPPLEKTYLGDARDLSAFEPESFDAVLCMGALYHLQKEADRVTALKQCLRVLKTGGILVITYVNRLGAIICNFSEDIKDMAEIMEFLDTGIQGVFYAHTPAAIDEWIAQFPLKKLYHIGADGIGYLLHGISQTISYEGLLKWREYHFATCEIQELLGYSYHGAYFAEKK